MTTLAQHSAARAVKFSRAAYGPSETMGDLLRRLGDISPNRVRMRPAPGTAKESDVSAIQVREDHLCELIDGTLVEKCMGLWESMLAALIGNALCEWVMPRKLGIVTGEAGMMQLFPGRVRIPDVAFIGRHQLPKGHGKNQPIPALHPDIAVEVLSETNTRAEMKLKREDYFKAGTRLVWEVDPSARTVTVFTSPMESTTLRQTQHLTGGEVLPGFKFPLRKLFAELPD
jgi:Uma2 family endonuclease